MPDVAQTYVISIPPTETHQGSMFYVLFNYPQHGVAWETEGTKWCCLKSVDSI